MSFMSFDYAIKDNSKYYQSQYAETKVDTSHKSKYVVQKGDNLWDISKRHLNDKDATNAEIQEMMYKIAKLNKKDSIEAVNNIKVNDVLYLPEVELEVNPNVCYVGDWFRHENPVKSNNVQVTPEKSGAELAAETAAKIIRIAGKSLYSLKCNGKETYQLRGKNKISRELYNEHGKNGIKYWAELLAAGDDSSLKIEKSYSFSPVVPTALHIVKKMDSNSYAPTEAHLYVQADKNGKLEQVAFNAPWVHINSISFDYILEKDGVLKRPLGAMSQTEKIDNLSKEEYNMLLTVLQGYLDRELYGQK